MDPDKIIECLVIDTNKDEYEFEITPEAFNEIPHLKSIIAKGLNKKIEEIDIDQIDMIIKITLKNIIDETCFDLNETKKICTKEYI